MKTKVLLFSLALSAGFAACTNEFEQFQPAVDQGQVALENRAKGEFILSATRGNANETRVVGAEYSYTNGTFKYFWEPTDVIGGILVDAFNEGTPADINTYPNYGFGNHPFTTDIETNSEDATFSTGTTVTEGIYVFYNAYDYENTNRRPVTGKLDDKACVITPDTEDEALAQIGSNVDSGGQNMFISPLVKMDVQYKQDNIVPITMKSIYHVLQLELTANVGTFINGFGINKVVVERSAAGAFEKEFILDPAKLAKAGVKARTKLVKANEDAAAACITAESYTDDPKAGVILTKDDKGNALDSKDVKKAMDAVAEELETYFDISSVGETAAKLVYNFDKKGVYQANGEKKIVQMLIPAGKHDALTVTVYTTEGTWKKTFTAHNKNDEMKGKYTRGNSTFVKGEMIIGADGTTNIDAYDFSDGFEIESQADYDFALEYIAEHDEKFNNLGTNHPIFKFKNEDPIKLKDVNGKPGFPNYKAEYIAENAGATLALDATVEFNPARQVFNETKTPVLDVAEGKVMTIKTATTTPLNVTGEGTVKVENNGTTPIAVAFEGMDIAALKIVGKSNVTITAAAFKIGSLNVAEAATLTAAGDVELTTAEISGVTTVNGTVINNGTVNVAAAVTATNWENDGTVNVNKGSLTAVVTNNAAKNFTVEMGAEVKATTFTNKGTLTLSGAGTTGKAYANVGTLNNYGKVKIEAAEVDSKSAFGGVMTVATALNNYKMDGGNEVNATVTNNGQLIVATSGSVENTNEIILGASEFAYIVLPDNSGKVRLTAPKNYPAPEDSDLDNIISNNGTTVYAEFNATNNVYSSLQASEYSDVWSLIDIVEVKNTSIEVVTSDNKEYYLLDGGKLSVNGNVTVKGVKVVGTNAEIKQSTVNGATAGVLTPNTYLTVEKSKSLTIAAGAEVRFPTTGAAFDVQGTLQNNGVIDIVPANDATTTTQNVTVGNSENSVATMTNNGRLGNSVPVVGDYSAVMKLIKDFIIVDGTEDFTGAAAYKGNRNNQTNNDARFIRFSSWPATIDQIEGDKDPSTNDVTMSAEDLKNWIYGGTLTMKAFSGYVCLMSNGRNVDNNNKKIVFYLGTTDMNDRNANRLKAALEETKTLGGVTKYPAKVAFGFDADQNIGTQFAFDLYGKLNLVNSEGKAAWGTVTEHAGFSRSGVFGAF